jgi:hypothetical protein
MDRDTPDGNKHEAKTRGREMLRLSADIQKPTRQFNWLVLEMCRAKIIWNPIPEKAKHPRKQCAVSRSGASEAAAVGSGSAAHRGARSTGAEQVGKGRRGRGLTDHGEEVDPPDDEGAGAAAHPESGADDTTLGHSHWIPHGTETE